MFGNRETATAVDNGKEEFLNANRAGSIKSTLTKCINLLVASKLDAQQIQEVFADTGIVNPLPTVQNIMARRFHGTAV